MNAAIAVNFEMFRCNDRFAENIPFTRAMRNGLNSGGEKIKCKIKKKNRRKCFDRAAEFTVDLKQKIRAASSKASP